MGKKSRRQREAGGGALQMKPDKRFEQDHWRHKDGSPVSLYETKRLYLALCITHEAHFSQIENDTRPEREEYMCLVVAKKFATKGEGSAIEAWKRWPRLQPHWPRIRRRICDQCGRRVALSEPRFLDSFGHSLEGTFFCIPHAVSSRGLRFPVVHGGGVAKGAPTRSGDG